MVWIGQRLNNRKPDRGESTALDHLLLVSDTTLSNTAVDSFLGSQPIHSVYKLCNLQDSWQAEFEQHYTFMTPEELKDYIEDKLNKTVGYDDNLALPAQRWGSEYIIVNIEGITEETDLRNYRVMRTSTRDSYTAFAFRKHFRLNNILTLTIQWFKDLGLWSYWRKNIDQETVRKHLLEERDIASLNGPQALSLAKLYPIFGLLIAGLVIAFLVLLMESWYYALIT